MNRELDEEYHQFMEKFSQYYEIELGLGKKVFDVDKSFIGFVCYKAMSMQRDPIIGLGGIYGKPCKWSQLKKFFDDNNLNIDILNVPPQIFVRLNAQDLVERLGNETFRKELLEKDFRVNDLYFNEDTSNIHNPNRNPKTDDYKKIKELLSIIGDTCQVNVTPHNFPELDVSERISQFENIYGKEVEFIDYYYFLMLFDNPVSEIIKLYDILERKSPEYKNEAFFSTLDICWAKPGEDEMKLNPHIKYEKIQEISATYYPERNLIEICSIYDYKIVGEADFELVSKKDPTFSIRPNMVVPIEIKPSEEALQKIRNLGVEVLIKK